MARIARSVCVFFSTPINTSQGPVAVVLSNATTGAVNNLMPSSLFFQESKIAIVCPDHGYVSHNVLRHKHMGD